MGRIWLVSDWHFGHDRDFIYAPRGYNSVMEANEIILQNHNSIVANDDDVYVLGDLMLGDNDQNIEYIKKMNGKLHVILGNHDTSSRIKKYKECENIISISYAERLNYKKWVFYLSHCPMIVAHEEEDLKLWSLHGHTHSKDKFCEIPHCYNVALDAHDGFPIEIEEVLKDIRNKALN